MRTRPVETGNFLFLVFQQLNAWNPPVNLAGTTSAAVRGLCFRDVGWRLVVGNLVLVMHVCAAYVARSKGWSSTRTKPWIRVSNGLNQHKPTTLSSIKCYANWGTLHQKTAVGLFGLELLKTVSVLAGVWGCYSWYHALCCGCQQKFLDTIATPGVRLGNGRELPAWGVWMGGPVFRISFNSSLNWLSPFGRMF